MECQCPLFSGDGGCLTHKLVMTERQREQCRSSEDFFDGFAHIGRPRKGPKRPTREAGTSAKLRPSQKPRQPDLTPADLPCIFRGDGTAGDVKCIPCSSGGRSSVDVYVCAVHFRCSMHNVSTRNGIKPVACITCDDRVEPQRSNASSEPETQVDSASGSSTGASS